MATPSLLPALFMKYGQVHVANQRSPHWCCPVLSLVSFFALYSLASWLPACPPVSSEKAALLFVHSPASFLPVHHSTLPLHGRLLLDLPVTITSALGHAVLLVSLYSLKHSMLKEGMTLALAAGTPVSWWVYCGPPQANLQWKSENQAWCPAQV